MANTSKDLDIVIKAKNEASEKFAEIGKTIEKTNDKAKSFNVSTVGLVAGLSALGVGFAKLSKDAMNFSSVQEAYKQLAGNMGADSEEILNALKKASGGTISEMDLMLTANRALTTGVAKNAEEFTGMMEFARQSARKMGISTQQAFDDLSTGIARNSIMILDNLGITKNDMNEAQESYAKSLGKTVEQLTDTEQKQSMVNATLAKARKETALNGEMQLNANELWAKTITLVSDLSVKIGSYFLPIIGQALSFAIENLQAILDWINKDNEGVQIISKTFFGLGKLLEAIWKTVKVGILVWGGLITTMIEAGKIVYAFAKDGINNITHFGDKIKLVIKAIGQAIKGDFSEAGETLKESITGNLQNTIEQFNKYGEVAKDVEFGINQAFKESEKAWSDYANLSGYEGVKEKVINLGDTIKSKISDTLDESSKKGSEAFEKWGESVSSFNEKTIDSLDEVSKKISDINNEIKKVTGDYENEGAGINSQMAEEYVKQEEKIKDLKQQIRDETDDEERNKLQQKLSFEEGELARFASIAIAYEDQVNEARRVNGLSEIARVMEELNKKKEIAYQEAINKIQNLQTELEAENEKYNKIKELQQIALQEQDKFLAQSEKLTTESVNAEIKKYNALAEAIARAKAGKTSSLLSNSASVDQRANQTVNNTINLTIEVKGGTKAQARTLGNAIIGELKTSNLLP